MPCASGEEGADREEEREEPREGGREARAGRRRVGVRACRPGAGAAEEEGTVGFGGCGGGSWCLYMNLG
jgi:hypothetical protein